MTEEPVMWLIVGSNPPCKISSAMQIQVPSIWNRVYFINLISERRPKHVSVHQHWSQIWWVTSWNLLCRPSIISLALGRIISCGTLPSHLWPNLLQRGIKSGGRMGRVLWMSGCPQPDVLDWSLHQTWLCLDGIVNLVKKRSLLLYFLLVSQLTICIIGPKATSAVMTWLTFWLFCSAMGLNFVWNSECWL